MSLQRSEHSLGDFLNLAETVDLHKQAAPAIHLKEGLGLLGVNLQAYPDGLLVVIGTTVDLRPLEQPCHDLVSVSHQRDDGVERAPGLGQIVVEGLYLLQRTRVTVQQEARLAQSLCASRSFTISLVISSLTYPPDSMIARTCPASGVSAVFIARKMSPVDRRNLIVLSDQLGLRTLACARRAHDDELH
jgi:hypothetical protein